MEAKLLVWGPFSPEIKTLLDYHEDYYEGMTTGKIVFSTFFNCRTPTASTALANFLNIDQHDPNYYHLNNFQCKCVADEVENDPYLIRDLEEEIPDGRYEWEGLLKLIKAGFEVYYDPGY